MATERFYKLPEEKRNRILQAAREELESVPFDELSINKVIQLAGIPRGSFYQYFDDKLDLLGCVIENVTLPLQEIFLNSLTKSGGDIFELSREILHAVCNNCMENQNFYVFKNIFPHLKAEEIYILFPFLEPRSFMSEGKLSPKIDEGLPLVFASPLYSNISKEKLNDALELVMALVQYTVTQLFVRKEQKEQICESFEVKLNMIKIGLLGKE